MSLQNRFKKPIAAAVSCPHFYDKKSAAAYLGVRPWRIRHLIETGELPYVVDAGKQLIDRVDLDRFADRMRKTKINRPQVAA